MATAAGTTTPKRDLRGGDSPWAGSRSYPLKPAPVPKHGAYDVGIVGAGISGALAAASLIGLGLSVIILDRRGAALGSTSASTAMIQWEIDNSLTELCEKLGLRKAVHAYRASLRGVMELRRIALSLGVDCDWIDRTSLTVTGSAMGQRGLAAELKLRQKYGLPSQWLDGGSLKAIYGIDRTGALVSGFNAELHPVKLTRGLLSRAIGGGMELVAPADVAGISRARGGVRLTLANGHDIALGKLIMCTGYEMLPAIPTRRFNLISTWALATERLPQARLDQLLPGRPIVWEQADPYLYLRTTMDGRIVAGGEDADFVSPAKRDRLIGRKQAAIEKKLRAFLPGFDARIEYAWSGTFAESPTGLPSIGPVPGWPQVFATLGAGGNGITYSAVAASAARCWVEGGRHPDLSLFRFD